MTGGSKALLLEDSKNIRTLRAEWNIFGQRIHKEPAHDLPVASAYFTIIKTLKQTLKGCGLLVLNPTA